MSEQAGSNHVYGRSNLRRTVVFQAFGQVSNSFFALIFALLLARYMSVENYAAYTGFSAVGVLTCFVTAIGMDRIVGKFLPTIVVEHGERTAVSVALKMLVFRLASYTFGASLLGILAIGAFGYNGPLFFGNYSVFSCYLYGFLFSTNEQLRLTLSALFKNKYTVYSSLVQWLFRVVPLGHVVFQQGVIDIKLAIVVTILGEIVAVSGQILSLCFLYLRFPEKKSVTGLPGKTNFIEISKFGLANYIASLISVPVSGGYLRNYVVSNETSLIGAVFGFFYALFDRVRPYFPIQMFENIVEVMISVAHSTGRTSGHIFRLIGLMVRMNLLFVIPISAWFMIFGNGIVNFISAGKYSGYEWIFSLLILSSVPTVLMTLCIFIANIYQLHRFVMYFSALSFVGTIVVFNVPGVSGVVAALAVAFVYPGIFCIGMLIVFIRQGLDVADFFRKQLEWLLFSILLFFLVTATRYIFGNGYVQQSMGAVLMIVGCLAWTRSRFPFLESERVELLMLFSNHSKIHQCVKHILG